MQCILTREPLLQRTPTDNPGYDLLEPAIDEQSIRWIEVKAMSGSLYDRPVGLSRTQFESAREHREAYWLYVVEHAGDHKCCASCASRTQPAGLERSLSTTAGSMSPKWIAQLTDGPAGESASRGS